MRLSRAFRRGFLSAQTLGIRWKIGRGAYSKSLNFREKALSRNGGLNSKSNRDFLAASLLFHCSGRGRGKFAGVSPVEGAASFRPAKNKSCFQEVNPEQDAGQVRTL
jgi:hypothetical protein